MKHIIKYKIFESTDYIKSNLVNHNLIEDLYELSLDRLDNGMTLLIHVIYEDDKYTHLNRVYICTIQISHDEKVFRWSGGFVKEHERFYDKKYLKYEFNFFKDTGDNMLWTKDDPRYSDYLEIESEIKEMYPDVNISFNRKLW